jgi:predicted Fe-S protein YdhL (DUF1289 family)
VVKVKRWTLRKDTERQAILVKSEEKQQEGGREMAKVS